MNSVGDVLYYGGIGIASVSGVVLIVEMIVHAVKKRRLRDRMIDRYGF